MNFDFSTREQAFFTALAERMEDFFKDRDPETRDAAGAEKAVRELLGRLAETPYLSLGLTGMENGWGGMVTLMPAVETLARYSPSLTLAVETSTRVFGRILARWGSDRQRKNILEPIVGGGLLGAVALSETAMNVHNDPLATAGETDGRQVVVNGEKTYVVNAPLADWLAVAGRLDGRDVVFLVEKGTPGLSCGDRLDTLGFEGAVISGLTLCDCRIPADQVIGSGKDDLLETVRLWENQLMVGASLGMMKGAFESARDHAKQHRSGGKPVIAYQEVGFKLSEMLTLFQTAELFAWRAAWYADAGKKGVAAMTDCAKVFCTENAEQVASWALQILSGSGYTLGNAAERAYRGAKYGQIAGVSTEIARVRIGDDTLGIRS